MTWQDGHFNANDTAGGDSATDRLLLKADKWIEEASKLEDLFCCAGEWRNQEAKTTAETLQRCARVIRAEIQIANDDILGSEK